MTFLRDVLEPRRSISKMDASEETAVPTSLPVGPLDLPSQAFRNGSDVDNCPVTRNPLPAGQEKVRKFHRRHNKGQSGSEKRELETVDDELNAVRNVIAAHKPMDANGLFLFSLKPYLQSTPQEMLTDLKMDLLHICSTYSEGRRPLSLRSYDW
ncbi:hypothetical protein MRX96_034767 [Rhipicephalus microplus]